MDILEKFFGGKSDSIDNSNLENMRPPKGRTGVVRVTPSKMPPPPPPPRQYTNGVRQYRNGIGSNPRANSLPPDIPGTNNNPKYTVTDIDELIQGGSMPNYLKKYSALQEINYIESYLDGAEPGTYKITISLEKIK